MANLTPAYKFWNRMSDNALLGDDASRTYNGDTDTWPTSAPLGDVAHGKLYPFKYKTAMQPITQADHRLIALNTYEYLKATGNADTAITQGLTAMGYPASEPYEWVLTDTYQLLNHGISPAGQALQCADCHGSTDRMDLQGELGYQLKASESSVCRQCHGSENNPGFTNVHDRHVRREQIDCASCHTFSREISNCPTDLTGDGVVNILDLVTLRSNFGSTCSPSQPCPGDITGDGVVNILDLVALRAAFGTSCP